MRNRRVITVVIFMALIGGAWLWIGTQRARPVAPESAVSATPPPAAPISSEKSPRPLRSSAKPTVSASPGGSARPSVVVPAVTATPATVVTAAPEAPPEIIRASLSRSVASPGDVVSGTVITSSNVASVEARIVGYSQSLTKTAAGTFTLTYQVPNVPMFFRRTYSIKVIARNARGETASLELPITIR